MKKIFTSALSIILTAVMTLSLCACSLSDIGKAETMEDYVKSDAVTKELEELRKTFSSSGMEIEILGEGNKLVYQYIIPESMAYNGMGDSMAAELSAQAETFTEAANSLKSAVMVENPVVVVRYLTSGGNHLLEREFPAE